MGRFNRIATPLLLAGLAAIAAPTQAQDGDAAAGEKVFNKCKACHMIGEGAKIKVGPVLNGVIGRQAGTYEGFKYGDSLVAAGEAGLTWNQEEIVKYLEDPAKYLQDRLNDKKARSKMMFKLRKEDDRKNVAAYVATFSD